MTSAMEQFLPQDHGKAGGGSQNYLPKPQSNFKALASNLEI